MILQSKNDYCISFETSYDIAQILSYYLKNILLNFGMIEQYRNAIYSEVLIKFESVHKWIPCE